MDTNRCHEQDFVEQLTNFVRNHDLELECCIPAIVDKYDQITNKVTCHPAINRIDTEGKSHERGKVTVPCFVPGANGLVMCFPLRKGDTGWLIACDRDSATFMEKKKNSDPDTLDLHRYAFGIFLPDMVNGFAVAAGNQNNIVIQTRTGSTCIGIGNGVINIKTDGIINVSGQSVIVNSVNATLNTTNANVAATGPVQVSATAVNVTSLGIINLTSAGAITITAPIATLSGDVTIGGILNVAGLITAPDVKFAQANLASHVHTDSAGKPTSPPNGN